ncbi:winged helix-turn-helix domain-containing protein [Actinopolymorpha alba]|uniref:winged helix-turn-helix domain-containing protein n=1 Tax=Actinopolymorpha alba TaxID=533267 RepID=UPI00036DB26A|nr:winged helix-turn-helix domain-containing protein [Actinopolymorpha alba]
MGGGPLFDSALDSNPESPAPPTGLILCIGLGTDVSSTVVANVGSDAAVLVVADAESAVRMLTSRRDAPRAQARKPDRVVEFGPLRLEENLREVSWRGRPIELSARQFDLLATLARDGGRVWSFADLTRAVWQRPYIGDADAVVSAVKRLRQRLSRVTGQLTVTSVRGVGYRLALVPTPLRPSRMGGT